MVISVSEKSQKREIGSVLLNDAAGGKGKPYWDGDVWGKDWREGEGEPLHCLEEEKLFPGRESITGWSLMGRSEPVASLKSRKGELCWIEWFELE